MRRRRPRTLQKRQSMGCVKTYAAMRRCKSCCATFMNEPPLQHVLVRLPPCALYFTARKNRNAWAAQ